jgi:hypothetical protein
MQRHIQSVTFVVAIALVAWDAQGQQPRYAPPMGGTPPSALNLFRFDSRSPRNYDNAVLQMQQTQNQLQNLSVRQQTDFRATQQSISQLREAEAAPTGVGAGFMNYSHYYRLRPGGTRVLRR